ncbi:MAG: hypothetical protein R8G66_13250 [Cytophagales bacterium]|nr:hypothetical protein [Cytophagales bacterium]
MKHLLALFLVCFVAYNVTGQLIAPVEELPTPADVEITLKDGNEIQGRVTSVMSVNGTIRSITVRDVDKNKFKFKAEEMQVMKVRMTELAKLESIGNSSSSLMEMLNADFEEIISREWVIYEQALLPKKKTKYALLQLLNPGFDSRIKIYQNPDANETGETSIGGFAVTGGEDTSYLMVKDGAKSAKVKKASYRKSFPEIFDGCEALNEYKDKPKFRDFAAHVFLFNKECE